jgi:hypothetical protein
MALPPQHLRGCKAGSAASYDHDRSKNALSHGGGGQMFWIGAGEFFSHEYLVANSFYAPMLDWVEGGRTQRFIAAQTETGVMQRTTQGIPNDETLRQRSMVMSAICANREKFLAAAHHGRVFAI